MTSVRRAAADGVEIDSFETIEATGEEKSRDVAEAALAHGLPLSNSTVGPLYRAALEQRRAAQRALLGEAGFAAYEDYERIRPARDLAGAFSASVLLAGMEINADQLNRLADAIAQASPRFAQGQGVSLFDIDWLRVDEKASAILTREQMELLRTTDPLTTSPGSPVAGRYWTALQKALSRARDSDPVFGSGVRLP